MPRGFSFIYVRALCFFNNNFLCIFMTQKSSIDKFYLSQNISIRRGLRQMDLYQTQQFINNPAKKHPENLDVNFVIVGADGSGKSSLLRTLYYALNGTLNLTKQCLQAGNIFYQKIDIKKNKKSTVKGCSKIHETEQKIGISGIQVSNRYEQKATLEKYTKACELIHGKMLGCLRQIKINGFTNINSMLICISVVDKLMKQDLMGLKFLITELQEKRIKYYIIGTKIDIILGSSQSIEQAENEKLQYIESWKKFVAKQLQCNKDNIYLIQNYTATSKQTLQNSETINFYALKLLQMITQEQINSTALKNHNLLTYRSWSCTC